MDLELLKASHCDYKMMLLMLDDWLVMVVDMVEVEVITHRQEGQDHHGGQRHGKKESLNFRCSFQVVIKEVEVIENKVADEVEEEAKVTLEKVDDVHWTSPWKRWISPRGPMISLVTSTTLLSLMVKSHCTTTCQPCLISKPMPP